MSELQSASRQKLRRNVSAVSRWLHIYLSMASFFILFFFAITGITLNHTEWFEDQQKTTNVKGKLDTTWVAVPDTNAIRKLEIVEFIRNKHHVTGAISEFVIDENQCTISFNGPGYTADVFVERVSGAYELSETRTGLFGVLNDLHKGRDSGKVWKWVIDISAVLMVLVSFTGLMMLWFLKKKRVAGFLTILGGAILSWIIYRLFVP
ncbi:MAG: PepSY-associated TM helix domain-containing protein [Chitinophagaceae bacterium]